MTKAGIANFWKATALVLHRQDQNYRALCGQLARIGLRAAGLFPVEEGSRIEGDVVFFDADLCHKDFFPWPQGLSPMPLIAILGSEAPGPLERALAHMPSAFIQKPIGSTGVFNALVVAHQKFAEAREARLKLADLTERVRARPLILRALLMLMRDTGLSDSAALDALRRQAMAERTSIEALAATLVAQHSDLPMHVPPREPKTTPPWKYSPNKRAGGR